MSQNKRGARGGSADEPRRFDLPKPGLDSCEREDWGRSTVVGGYPSHLHVRHIAVPEGILMVAACGRCGGREETLVDLRTLVMFAGPELHAQPTDFEALNPSKAWLQQHLVCPGGLAPLPSDTQAFVSEIVQASEGALHVGATLVPTCWVQTEGGGMGALPVEELMDDTIAGGERLRQVLERNYGLRELIRQGMLDLRAAVLAFDIYVDEQTFLPPIVGAKHGDEGLFLALVMPGAARCGWAPITRSGTGAKEQIGRPVWLPESASVWVDGIFARRVAPVPIGPTWRAGLN